MKEEAYWKRIDEAIKDLEDGKGIEFTIDELKEFVNTSVEDKKDQTSIEVESISFNKEALYKLLSDSVIDLPSQKISSIYQALNLFNGPTCNLVFSKNHLKIPQTSPDNILHDIISNGQLYGIDFPFWFSPKTTEPQGSRVMIIGIDPLRNIKTFRSYNAKYKDDIIIGTPYAVHDTTMRDRKTQVYWKFIVSLVENNFVYLTDIYKCYFHHTKENLRSSVYFQRHSLVEPFNNLILNEVLLVKPTHIITFGGIAFEKISALKNNHRGIFESIQLINLIHPAARAKSWLPVLEGKNATVSNKVDYMKSKVRAYNL